MALTAEKRRKIAEARARDIGYCVDIARAVEAEAPRAQEPVPCQKCAAMELVDQDVFDCLTDENQVLKAKVAEQVAEIERLTKINSNICERANRNLIQNARFEETIEQQATRIADLKRDNGLLHLVIEQRREQLTSAESALSERDAKVAEQVAEIERLKFSFAGCSQQLKDACADLDELESSPTRIPQMLTDERIDREIAYEIGCSPSDVLRRLCRAIEAITAGQLQQEIVRLQAKVEQQKQWLIERDNYAETLRVEVAHVEQKVESLLTYVPDALRCATLQAKGAEQSAAIERQNRSYEALDEQRNRDFETIAQQTFRIKELEEELNVTVFRYHDIVFNLEAEATEQCRIIAMGGEREATLLGKVDHLTNIISKDTRAIGDLEAALRVEKGKVRIKEDECAALYAKCNAQEYELNEFREAVKHVTEEGITTRAFSSFKGWAMVHFDYLAVLECAEEQVEGMQAQIDALMLEYCPDEMSLEQKENWAKNQMKAEEHNDH